jgi:hypothetical protein
LGSRRPHRPTMIWRPISGATSLRSSTIAARPL